jgi:hypothetical protein
VISNPRPLSRLLDLSEIVLLFAMSEEHPVLKPKKRNSADAESVGDTPAPRSKRGKYTSVAW